MKRWPKGFVKAELTPIVAFASVIVAWQVIVEVLNIPSFLVPTPVAVVNSIINPQFSWLVQTYATVMESVEGLAIAALVGVALAFLIILSPIIRKAFTPFIVIVQVLPKVAIAPIIYILLGFTLTSRVLIVAATCFFPIFINMTTGLTDVDRNLVYLLTTLGARESTIFRKVRLPNSLPFLFDGMKIAATLAIIGAVVAEFVSSQAGLGFVIIGAQDTGSTSVAFASLTLLTVLGLALYASVALAAYEVMPWYRRKH